MSAAPHGRTIGLFGATSVGVGAIVGGGILALAGVAFATTGPAAILAFALNGAIAVVTALSFAELSSRFPESGGTYTFAKKVLSLEAAFAVGWVVWFASIVAAVLYALGFGAFAVAAIAPAWRAVGTPPAWLETRATTAVIALAATAGYGLLLSRRSGGGGAWINVVKVVVFLLIIAGGLAAVGRGTPGRAADAFRPFLPHGGLGLLQAMGFTFIALQGFDLIAAVAGEVREPARTVPRSMLLSLGIALGIYLPLLFVITAAGAAPGETIAEVAARNPETIVALAGRRFLGALGFWTVIAAGILSMLSALEANLFAASRVAVAMARDRALPHVLETVAPRTGAPRPAVVTTALVVGVILVVIGDVAAAGAAASLIFLITFALAQGIAILARRRVAAAPQTFRVPWAPALPAAGALACTGLAVFQGVAVPAAGMVAAAWLAVGGVLFLALFAHRARVRDAAREAHDPELMRLRGRRPLVLVPIANPANAPAMVAIANALAPPQVGRVLLLAVAMVDPDRAEVDPSRAIAGVQAVLGEALTASVAAGLAPEAMATIAPRPWPEIVRVARTHGCESMLVGLSDLGERLEGGDPLEEVIGRIGCDTVVLRSTDGWDPRTARRILVPVGGRGGHDVLRARLIGNLRRVADRELHYLRIVAPGTPRDQRDRAERILRYVALDEADGTARATVEESDSPREEIVRRAAESDLVILGLQRSGRRRLFGDLARRIALETPCPMILISRGG